MAVRRSAADGLPVYGANRKNNEEHVFIFAGRPSGKSAPREDPTPPAKPDPDRILGRDQNGDEEE